MSSVSHPPTGLRSRPQQELSRVYSGNHLLFARWIPLRSAAESHRGQGYSGFHVLDGQQGFQEKGGHRRVLESRGAQRIDRLFFSRTQHSDYHSIEEEALVEVSFFDSEKTLTYPLSCILDGKPHVAKKESTAQNCASLEEAILAQLPTIGDFIPRAGGQVASSIQLMASLPPNKAFLSASSNKRALPSFKRPSALALDHVRAPITATSPCDRRDSSSSEELPAPPANKLVHSSCSNVPWSFR